VGPGVTSFEGWLNSWLSSWGGGAVGLNAVAGTATVTLLATGALSGITATPTTIAPAGRRPRRTEPAWLHIPHTPYFPPDPEPQQTDTEDDVLMLCMH